MDFLTVEKKGKSTKGAFLKKLSSNIYLPSIKIINNMYNKWKQP